ncbi:MAG TPA: ABC transporter ATP-binding protein, partial [Firmicutes bacterium]|nr:ABC transporter ATP-binding protein [Bacillota bacterium]
RASSALEAVGLIPSLHLDRHPHEFSGGQRQRICIARALSMGAKIIFADEPVSSLDVSIQAQILILMKKLKEEFGLTYIFVTHDLALTRSFANRVHVMYLGEMVESGPVEEIFKEPYHPYTRLLLASTPIPNPRRARSRETVVPKGEIPSSVNPPPGCRFHTRCPMAKPECKNVKPEVRTVGDRSFACHLVNVN